MYLMKVVVSSNEYNFRKGDQLETLSCTDLQCQWKQVQTDALKNYDPAPLMQSTCNAQPIKRKKIIKELLTADSSIEAEEVSEEESTEVENVSSALISSEDQTANKSNGKKRKPAVEIVVSTFQLDEIKSLICNNLPQSALAKHV